MSLIPVPCSDMDMGAYILVNRKFWFNGHLGKTIHKTRTLAFSYFPHDFH